MSESPGNDDKDVLHRYLVVAREALLWKIEGLSGYDQRRPMVPTGTNLLGLVKHVAWMGAGYLGDVFDRPFNEAPPWEAPGADANADLWVPEGESVADVLALWQRAWGHADATVAALPLDAVGSVPWWPEERRHATLQLVLVHVLAEVNRHAGHADVCRELIDGAAGLRRENTNLTADEVGGWPTHRQRVEAAARAATATATAPSPAPAVAPAVDGIEA